MASTTVNIRFTDSIFPDNSIKFFNLIEKCLRNKFRIFNIFISTPGGSISNGLTVANYLLSLPIELNTYNIGAIDSIGILIFLAGKNRYSYPQSRFMFHPPGISNIDMSKADYNYLSRKIHELQIDAENIISFISERTSLDKNVIRGFMDEYKILSSKESIKYGISKEVKKIVIKNSHEILSIND